MSAFCWLLCWSVILSPSKEGFAFTLPDTGQTKCYDTAGAEISCTGTGQDGDYSINPMSYTDNGNGTITDNVTGLMWQKGADTTQYTWYEASGTYDATYNASTQSVCGNLTLGGHSDWRLPTKKELMSIVDYGLDSIVINTTYFDFKVYTSSSATYTTIIYSYSNYWSSSPFAGDTSGAWYVNFYDGSVNISNEYSSNSVRCVRGGQSSPSFTDNGNGTVTDNVTGLMWQQGEPGSMTWDNALTYCEGLSLGGQTDWRLPNIKELESITDDSKSWSQSNSYDLAIDKTYFPNAKGDDYYWSSTHYSYYSTNSACYSVFFAYGTTYETSYYSCSNCGGNPFQPKAPNRDTTNSGHYVRCVRGGGYTSSENKCAATVSSSLAVYVPVITYNGSNYWASLQYNSATGELTITDAGAVTDASAYSGCTASTLSSDFSLHIPDLTYGGTTYSLDLEWNGSGFTITGIK